MVKYPFLFLKSALAKNNGINSLPEIKEWLAQMNNRIDVHVELCDFESIDQWGVNSAGAIAHQTGKFFSITGINVKTNWGAISEWDQPIINQPEIGFLGFITKEFNGVLHFLVQAKIEPGNINWVQLSPTLQATKSNYTQVHNGQKPHYIDYFQNARKSQILLDQLQSEQGGRFHKKRNRNIIIKVEEEVNVNEGFKWMTLAQIKTLMSESNLVNMDTRTVLSGISYGNFDVETIGFFNYLLNENHSYNLYSPFIKSFLSDKNAHSNIDDVISTITERKSHFELDISFKPLSDLQNWIFDKHAIYHYEKKFFSVVPVKVSIENREVKSWFQPMVKPAQEGLCAFVGKEINGILHFIVQLKVECGNHDILELAPTVQCLTGNYRETGKGNLPFLDYVLNAPEKSVLLDVMQSEEGGRFYHEQNRNMIIIANEDFQTELPENYLWLTLNQMISFLRYNNYLNIQARSLIAAMPLGI